MTDKEEFDLIGNINVAEPTLGIQIGKTVLRTHAADLCVGQFCSIHNPSDHPLKDAPLNWRGDRRLMERICEHGIGHIDPDDLEFKRRTMSPESFERGAYAVHGCCGCCSPP